MKNFGAFVTLIEILTAPVVTIRTRFPKSRQKRRREGSENSTLLLIPLAIFGKRCALKRLKPIEQSKIWKTRDAGTEPVPVSELARNVHSHSEGARRKF